MGPREDTCLDPDWPDLVELAAVEPVPAFEHLVAQHLLLELVKDFFRFEAPLDLTFGNRRDELFEQLIDPIIVLELAANPHGLAERHVHLLLDLAVEIVADLLFLDGELRLAGAARQFVDSGDDLLDRGVSRIERRHGVGSGTSLAPASTITMPSLVPATTRSSVLSLRCAKVGLITNCPPTMPTRTPAMVFWNGMLDMASAAEAPVMASTSESLSVSAESSSAITCVS